MQRALVWQFFMNRKVCYAASLTAKGIPADHIHKYGFAFEGKQVLIG